MVGRKPRLLDLFCGAGGAARGYMTAGFHVTGVDLLPQPNYCGDEFVQGDAMTYSLEGFDAVHASPPCQHYAPVTRWRGDASDHPDLLAATVRGLEASGLPWVVENVPYAPMQPHFILCGSMFGLRVRRHRWFLTSWSGFEFMPHCQHRPDDLSFDHGGKQPESVYRDAMGCDWMTVRESRNAIPPAYTEWIGQRLLAQLKAAA